MRDLAENRLHHAGLGDGGAAWAPSDRPDSPVPPAARRTLFLEPTFYLGALVALMLFAALGLYRLGKRFAAAARLARRRLPGRRAWPSQGAIPGDASDSRQAWQISVRTRSGRVTWRATAACGARRDTEPGG